MERPKHLDPPRYLSKSPPVPVPVPEEDRRAEPPDGEEERLDPTRYGDWEKMGKAIDF